MRILIADADGTYRQTIVKYIEGLGHQAQEALSGRQVLDICRVKCPDLILLDKNIGSPTANETLKQIRQLGGVALWNPLVLLSASFTDDEIEEAMKAGVDDFLPKPLSLIRLKARLVAAQRHLDLKDQVFTVAHDLVVANRALEGRVTQDVMTGIANASSFDDSLERDWFKAKRAQSSLCLILLNLDYFQAFNQVYGAEAGDNAIKRVAEALKLSLPQSAFLARTTGETFAVLINNLSQDEVCQLAERLRQVVLALKIPHSRSGCSEFVTASFGVSLAGKEGVFTQPLDLREAADFALYQAKHAGRNRVNFELMADSFNKIST